MVVLMINDARKRNVTEVRFLLRFRRFLSAAGDVASGAVGNTRTGALSAGGAIGAEASCSESIAS
jgi:hypothetical protein